MAFKDEINYEKISQINKKERKSSKLTNLDPDFYSALIRHLKELQNEYNKKYLESPTSTEALLLNNEICKLDGIIKEIYTRRERKILLSALDASTAPNLKNMLDHEQELYKTIVKVLSGYKDEILNQKPKPVCEKSEHIAQPETTVETEAGNRINPQSLKTTTVSSSPDLNIERDHIADTNIPVVESTKVLVQVLEDIEQFVGTDLITYDLHKEDLATIPQDIAEILEINNKVRILEPNI